ncbi:MAG: hypothetical protein M1829_006060 [Trizodia sp. TS-e1964]|nr:MAG: hypothetical protein M1829_006060 [Trizodia sp. TS-e1964]
MKSFISLATSALCLLHLATAVAPFPEGIRVERSEILEDVERVLIPLDSTKATLFAYRTRSTPQESWGFGFFNAETASTAKPIAQRDFYLLAPPKMMSASVMFSSFGRFLPQTECQLVFVRQIDDAGLIREIAEALWGEIGDPEAWYTEFGARAMALE